MSGHFGQKMRQLGLQLSVKYIVYDDNKVKGLEMFDGIAPLSEDSHRFIKGNAGFEHVFSWNANNKAHVAGGTTIKNEKSQTKATGNRKYFFWFESQEDLTLALFHLFNQDRELVNEFYKSDGRFTVTKKPLPSHFIRLDEDDMDTDDDYIQTDEKPKLDNSDSSLEYDPGAESQQISV